MSKDATIPMKPNKMSNQIIQIKEIIDYCKSLDPHTIPEEIFEQIPDINNIDSLPVITAYAPIYVEDGGTCWSVKSCLNVGSLYGAIHLITYANMFAKLNNLPIDNLLNDAWISCFRNVPHEFTAYEHDGFKYYASSLIFDLIPIPCIEIQGIPYRLLPYDNEVMLPSSLLKQYDEYDFFRVAIPIKLIKYNPGDEDHCMRRYYSVNSELTKECIDGVLLLTAFVCQDVINNPDSSWTGEIDKIVSNIRKDEHRKI